MLMTKGEFAIKCERIISSRANLLKLSSSATFTIFDEQYIVDYVLYNSNKFKGAIVGQIECYNDKISQKEMVLNPALIDIIKGLE